VRADLFQRGNLILHSGQPSWWKIEADSLTDAELSVLAQLLAQRLPPFGRVEGVPRGGLRLAEALAPWVCGEDRLLICDDVYTTGASMEAHRAGREAIGAVLFAREPVTQDWITPLFALTPPRKG
jgi:hypothetical protein